jgi:hypothetical protein
VQHGFALLFIEADEVFFDPAFAAGGQSPEYWLEPMQELIA